MGNTAVTSHSTHVNKFSLAGSLIALGIIFGDIGTSPLYVFKAIVGAEPISKELAYGGMSCVFWTLTIITTIKYVWMALNADNNGEGGILALYALVRRYKTKWIVYAAIIGCASLIADGFITPPISISSAIEGLENIPAISHTITPYIMPIVLAILVSLFVFQQFGTHVIGRIFGPVMFVWFVMMSGLGINQIMNHPEVFAALNPYYAINLLVNHPGGFWLLGSVFLCTTGAEAMYSDLGHCGKYNIRVSWSFVKTSLILNYLGQTAWLVANEGKLLNGKSPFYLMMPEWFLIIGVGVATVATIIASQALITGVFTLTNEAMKLKLWPNLKVNYPSQLKGQIYIPAMNWILMFGCISVVLLFKESKNMEAAYGLAITFDMIMTTSLLSRYLLIRRKPMYIIGGFLLVYFSIEGSFLVSNVLKFFHGGWFTFLIATLLFMLMYILYRARILRSQYTEFVPLDDYDELIEDISNDKSIPKESTHLVYLCMSNDKRMIDKNVIYSIARKRPKRADVYWFLHVDISDDPYEKKYSVETVKPGKIFFVHLIFGFKVEHQVSLMFKRVVDDMRKSGEIMKISNYPSLIKHNIPGDFKYILLNSRVSIDEEISPFNQFIIRSYRIIKHISLAPVEDFGLESTNVEVETVPIDLGKKKKIQLTRFQKTLNIQE